ncbi:hypothetical protein FRC03_005390 [Tulasnella sp. 419]|nr:hypothetical protein FRC03_005390 [Tulasnella sp. 419]
MVKTLCTTYITAVIREMKTAKLDDALAIKEEVFQQSRPASGALGGSFNGKSSELYAYPQRLFLPNRFLPYCGVRSQWPSSVLAALDTGIHLTGVAWLVTA